jgi:hypothetical protein
MAICFVIQPFDSGSKYDKRFEDIYKPAIEAADLASNAPFSSLFSVAASGAKSRRRAEFPR